MKGSEIRYIDRPKKRCERVKCRRIVDAPNARGVVELFENAWIYQIPGGCSSGGGTECPVLESRSGSQPPLQ